MSKSSRTRSEESLAPSTRKAIDRLLGEMEDRGDIPGLPQIVVKLNAVAANPKSSAADLANVILRDQSLTSRTLRVSNSALYGASGRGIATVTQAVILLGFQNVARIAQGMAVFDMLDTSARDQHLVRIWVHSIACAVAAEELARIANAAEREEAFVAGLLHDVGKLILLRNAPEEYRRILEGTGRDQQARATEREELGFTHEDVGAAAARRWNLPDALVDVLAGHHDLDTSGDSLRNVVALANRIAKLAFASNASGAAGTLPEIERLVSIHLGVSPERLGTLIGSLRANVEEYLEVFGLEEARGSKRVAALGASEPGQDDPLQALYVAMEADVHRKGAQIALLQQISHSLASESEPEQLVPTVLEGLYVSLQLTRVALVLRQTGGARGVMGFGEGVSDMLSRLDLGAPGHPLADVLAKNRPLHVLDRALPAYAERLGDWDWLSPTFAAVPIPTASGAIGLLVGDRGEEPLSEDDVNMMALFANQMSLALARRAAS